jgi:universal stress protein A
MNHKNILIAIDSSDEAGEVVSAARDIAGDSGASLSLITVITPVAYVYGADYGMVAASTVNIEQVAADLAKSNQSALEKRFGIQCEKTVAIGRPAYEIRKLAESSNADLIVIGSHGRHGLNLILGSTANGVLHGAPCDVYVVRIKD